MAPRIPLPGGFGQYRKPIGNMMSDLGYGISQGGFKKGFGIGAGRMAEMAPYRAQMAGLEEQKAEEAEQENQTLEWLRAKGAEDPRFAQLAQAVEAGGMDIGSAWQTGLQYLNATPEPTKGIEINGRLVNPLTGEEMGNFSDPETPNSPAGYRPAANSNLEFIPGGPADPASASANKGDTEQTRRARQLATVVNPQIAIVEQNWEALANSWDQAKATTGQAGLAVPFGLGAPGSGYQQAANALQTIAQSYLYSVSGAAAPAEEVRKIVDSVTPKYGEDPELTNNKLALVKEMVNAINTMANGGGTNNAPANTQFVYNPQTGELE